MSKTDTDQAIVVEAHKHLFIYFCKKNKCEPTQENYQRFLAINTITEPLSNTNSEITASIKECGPSKNI